MTIEDYEIVGSYNNQRVTSIDAERSVNLFEYIDPLGKKPKSLLSTSGLLSVPDLTIPSAAGVWRAQFIVNLGASQLMFGVIGTNVYRIEQTPPSATLTATQINTAPLTTAVGYVGIDANNGNGAGHIQVIFVDGLKGYIYNVTTTLWTEITDAAFPPKPIDVCYLDGFFIVAHGETNQFQLSQLNEGLIWGPDSATGTNTFTLAAGSADVTLTSGTTLNYQVGTPVIFAGGGLPAELVAGTTYYVVLVSSAAIIKVSATDGGAAITSAAGGNGTVQNNGQLQQAAITSHPGTIVACRTLHRQVFLFSQFYTEVWENLGIGTNLPLRRNNGLLIEYGTPSIGSIATGFDRMFFLSEDRDGLGSVMGVTGSEAQPVSGRALDYALSQYVFDPAVGVYDARAFLIKENGLIFYRLNFTNANHTYVFGVTMSDAQNLRWHEEEVLNGDRHPAQTHAYFYGRNYVGAYDSIKLYIVDDQYSTNDGEAIRRMRIGKPIMPPTSKRLRIDRWQLDLLQGQIDSAPSIEEALNLVTENNLHPTLDDLEILSEADINIILDQPLIIFNTDNAPEVFLSISKDGGQSYGYRASAPMGRTGERTFRTVWRKLGTTKRGQAFVPRIEFFNQMQFIVLGATWVYDVLPE